MDKSVNQIIEECQVYFENNPHSYETPKGLALKLGRMGHLVEQALVELERKGILQSQTSPNPLETIYFRAQTTTEFIQETYRDPTQSLEPLEELTNREEEVYRLLIAGRSNTEISESLLISKHTTKNHISNIYKKLSVNDRIELFMKYKPRF